MVLRTDLFFPSLRVHSFLTVNGLKTVLNYSVGENLKTHLFFGVFALMLFASSCTSPMKDSDRNVASSGQPVVAPPSPPPLVCNVKDPKFGAKGDGVSVDTAAIQSAINACKEVGGIVVFPAGTFMSGMVTVGSNMTIRFEFNAVLKGLRAGDQAYPFLEPSTLNGQLLNCRRALLYADWVHDLTLEGPGTIDGNGAWSQWQQDKDKKDVKEALRPMAVFIVKATNLNIRNLKVRDAAMWAVVLMETKHTRIDNLNVDSRVGPTRDGLDLVDGEDIVVDHSSISSGDDSFCLKSGIASGLNNVTIQNSHVIGSGTNGLKFGTASVGIVKDIKFENILIEHVNKAAMTVESIDGSHIENVSFKHIQFQDVGTPFFVLLGLRKNTPVDVATGKITGVSFEDIKGDGTRYPWGSPLSGTVINGQRHAIEKLSFKNVHIGLNGDRKYSAGHFPPTPPEYAGQYPDPDLWGDLPAYGMYFRHVDGIHLEDVVIHQRTAGDQRPTMPSHGGLRDFDIP